MRNNLPKLYDDQATFDAAFLAVTAEYYTQTATGADVPLVELGGTEGPLVQSARTIAALLLGNSAPADRDPRTIDLAIRYTGQIIGIPEEQADVAVTRELLAQTSDRMSL